MRYTHRGALHVAYALAVAALAGVAGWWLGLHGLESPLVVLMALVIGVVTGTAGSWIWRWSQQ